MCEAARRNNAALHTFPSTTRTVVVAITPLMCTSCRIAPSDLASIASSPSTVIPMNMDRHPRASLIIDSSLAYPPSLRTAIRPITARTSAAVGVTTHQFVAMLKASKKISTGAGLAVRSPRPSRRSTPPLPRVASKNSRSVLSLLGAASGEKTARQGDGDGVSKIERTTNINSVTFTPHADSNLLSNAFSGSNFAASMASSVACTSLFFSVTWSVSSAISASMVASWSRCCSHWSLSSPSRFHERSCSFNILPSILPKVSTRSLVAFLAS